MAMATGSDSGMKCEETCCHGHPVLIHYINQVRRRICHACALKKGHIHLLGHKKWYCERHQESVKSFCITHEEGCCKSCALIFHQSPCQVTDIHTILDEKQKLLDGKLSSREKSSKVLKDCLHQVSDSVPALEKSFQKIEDEVIKHFDEALEKESEREEEAIKTIEEEYKEKMKLLLQKKDIDLARCQEEAEKQRKPLRENKKEILDEIYRCQRILKSRIEKLQRDLEQLHRSSHDLKIKINHVLHAEQDIVLRSVEVCAEIERTLKRTVEMKGLLKEKEIIMNSISLLKKRRNGREHHRLYSTLQGSWQLVDEFRIPSYMNDLRILGCAFEGNTFFQDIKTGEGYVFDPTKREMVKVLQYDGRGLVNYCTPIDEDSLLCGRTQGGCFKKTLHGCICVYDSKWNLKKDFHIPRNTSGSFSCVSVDVDCDGMIVASEAKQSNIYIINSADGSIVKIIRMQDRKCKRSLCMSSGEIVVSTSQGEFIILDRTGNTKRIIRDDEWRLAVDFSLDPLLDTMYVVYWDESQCVYAVDQVSVVGKISKKILTFPQASWLDTTSKVCTYPIVITHSGKLVACNEDNIMTYKRRVCFIDVFI
ncbi:uncharacterized protein LOC135153585 [Lytechinus pictus]|uniref:uncharacterized protein LOC135153585 n=1 Tax=Lytechinus pictus TaxID=7653 RepID=UPI0030BA0F6B